MKYYKGIFRPKNPQKYRGNIHNITYRSSWELRVMKFLDENPNILEYSSEELIIPYRSPLDGKVHRYYPDFKIKVRDKDGVNTTYVIEVKPAKQSKPPEPQKRQTKRYITEVATWGKNQAKWKAASEYCADRGWKFMVLTEKELGINS